MNLHNDGEPEGAFSVGGNSLPKALNRKIHAEGAQILRLRLLDSGSFGFEALI